jgi:hypothetical protein
LSTPPSVSPLRLRPFLHEWAGRSRDAPRVHAFEIAAAAFLVSVVVTLRSRGLALGWDAARQTLPTLAKGLAVPLLLYGVPLQALARVVRREPLGPWARTLLTPSWLLLSLRAWLALVALAFGYMWLKVSVPLLRRDAFDAPLWELDARLHFGVQPSLFATGLFERPVLAALDVWYDHWLLSVLVGVGFAVASTDALFRRRVVLSVVLTWAAGAWLYVAVPALGPVYSTPRVFDEVRRDMPRAVATQDALWINHQKVLAGRSGPLPSLNPARGIAAFPSLHVAAHVLLLLWPWPRARLLRAPLAFAVLLTVAASVVSGWHYLLDAHAGAVLAVAAVLASRGLVRDPPRALP